jgi:DNA-binding FadR family transcriptional regulator
VQDEHAAVYRAIVSGNAARAAAAARTHLRNTAKRLERAKEVAEAGV